MNLRIASLVAIAASIILSEATAQQVKQPVRIRNWEFAWTVVEIGDASFKIVKTDDTLYAQLTGGIMSSLRLTPQQAANVAPLLWNTEKQLRVLKRVAEQKNEKASKRVDIEGGIQVVYTYNPKQGGRVYVADKRSFILRVGFTVTEAETLAEKMEQAVALAEAVDVKIRPNE